MRCVICKKGSDEATLYDGILDKDMVTVCDNCAETEGIPLIKKPSVEQIKTVERRPSVRERMERLSGYRDRTEISNEQISVQKNLAKLKNPYKHQTHQDVEDNYYWEINMARRRKKLSVNQLSELTGIDSKKIESLEKGVLIDGFGEILLKLESFLGIKLIKKHSTRVSFHKTNNANEESRILAEVRRKMGEKSIKTPEDNLLEEIEKESEEEKERLFSKKEKLRKISSGDIDMSKRQNLEDVTLNDLINMKMNREKSTEKKRAQLREEAMVGDDLDIEIDEL